MVGPAKARSPLLGPSGPACTMEMSYHIHSDPQGNLLPTPRVPCLLPAPRPPMPTCLCCLSQPCFAPSHHPGAWVSVSLHPVTVGWCHGGLPQGGQGFWVPTASAPPLVPGFLAISVADHTTGTSQLVWKTQGRGRTTGGHVRVPLGERSRAFQVCWLHRDQPGGLSVGHCQCCWAPQAHGCCPQVELLALVDLQGSASVSVDNVTFKQCYLDVVSPTAAGMARGAWAGKVTPHPFHGGCLVAVALSKSRTMVHKAEGRAQSCLGLGPLSGVNLGSGAVGQGERTFGGPVCFCDALPLSTSILSPLSVQSCPATLRGACVDGTRIYPVTSNGSTARGRDRALTTPLAQVRGWLLFGGTQEPRASHSLQSPGPRHALYTPSSPMPME